MRLISDRLELDLTNYKKLLMKPGTEMLFHISRKVFLKKVARALNLSNSSKISHPNHLIVIDRSDVRDYVVII